MTIPADEALLDCLPQYVGELRAACVPLLRMTLRRNAEGVEAPVSPQPASEARERTASLPPGEDGTVERATAAASTPRSNPAPHPQP